MSIGVLKSIGLPPVCEREVLRYAGAPSADETTLALLSECIAESENTTAPAVCFCELSFKISGDICDLGHFSVKSRSLAKNLSGCERLLIFSATAGAGFDRLIAKYIRLSPAKALMLSSIGTERAEAVCDTFLRYYSEKNGVRLKPRFSPGYGDLPLDTQREIFATLDPYKNIGVALGASLLMTPTKSVTAFVGII